MDNVRQSECFTIRVGGYESRFSSAHFTIFGERREPLHGHNYEVRLEVAGVLTEDGYVLDFGEAKAVLRDICSQLDHKVIVPTGHAALTVERVGGSVEVSFRADSFRFPADDVLLLPISNATTELLARYICRLVVEAFLASGHDNVTGVCVSVEEAGGQVASYREQVRCSQSAHRSFVAVP